MRPLLVLMFGAVLLASCSKPAPPVGRWEGAYDAGGTFVAARLEIEPDGQVRVSAPDIADADTNSEDDRVQMRQTMAGRLAAGWDAIAPRPMDFDGTTFRKPGGIAPQIDWDSGKKTMTLYVYLGIQPALHLPLKPVGDFSDNPWTH
jgi:hypothetical protein